MRKKKIFVLLMVLVLVVGSVVLAKPPVKGGGSAGGTTAEPAADKVKLPDGTVVLKSKVGDFLGASGCSGTSTTNCYTIDEDKKVVKVYGGTAGTELDKGAWKIEGGKSGSAWKQNVYSDQHGNMYAGKDVYTKNGDAVTLPSGVTKDNIEGEITLIGKNTPAIPLGENKVNVGGVELDKGTYQKLKSSSTGQNLEVNVNQGKISWKMDNKDYSVTQFTHKETGIKTTSLQLGDGVEQVWTTPDGKSYCNEGCTNDGWKLQQDGSVYKLEKDGTVITSHQYSVTDTVKAYMVKEIKGDDETRTIINIKDGTKEVKEFKNDKLKKEQGTKKIGDTIYSYEAEIEDGEVEYKRVYDEKGNTKYVIFVENGQEVTYEVDAKGEKVKKTDESDWTAEEQAVKNAKKAIDIRDNELFFRGNLLQWGGDIFSATYAALQASKPTPSISSLLLGKEFMTNWREKVDKWFAGHVLGEEWFASKICEENIVRKYPGGSAAYIQTISGTYQFVASIRAERSKQQVEMLCDAEGNCPHSYVCKDDFCYEDEEAETPAKGYFYKITWGVTAPRDESFTVFTDENRKEIDFNLGIDSEVNNKLDGEGWIFRDPDTGIAGPDTNHLELGASSKSLEMPSPILDYHPTKYSEACIIFGANKPTDRLKGDIRKVCTEIVDSDEGKVNWELSGKSETAKAKSKPGTYCGLGGC